ncbi:hypothetical protein A2264_03920 [candidate division WWE3 bacterium RIFOXYA2_FULL_46_9]|uniref:Uncharacterized protein n=1 Tax=candidate division WWE3 bacterium RIFOXYA2_FULL_46_9 TaxID=1802636 RepID=A0A1F4W069_UNCKA|nr:MAG: hypothetical protein A2264_03920 [candidate division WWE3 bacterium RIFOXYA2_FULL_46_9]
MSGGVTPGSLAVFAGTAGIGVAIALVTLLIRKALGTRRRRGKPEDANVVQGALFGKKLRYQSKGSVAEFVIIFGTIAFVIMLFWLSLGFHGVK